LMSILSMVNTHLMSILSMVNTHYFGFTFRFVGPTLKGEIGDMIIITFRNAVTKVNGNFSVHPHGLFYTKSHEGTHLFLVFLYFYILF